MNLLATTFAKIAQIPDCRSEEAANKFLLEKLIHRFDGGRGRQQWLRFRQFGFGTIKIEWYMHKSAAAFQPLRSLRIICDKSIDTYAQESPQARLRGIEIMQVLLLKKCSEEILSEVFSVFVRLAPADANVLIDRFPVRLCDCIKRAGSLGRIFAPRRQHGGPACERKFTARAADFRVFYHRSPSSDPSCGK